MPPKMQSPPVAANPPPGAPADYYDPRSHNWTLILLVSAPNSHIPADFMTCEPAKELKRILSDIPSDLAHIKEEKLGVVCLRNIPNLPGQPVVECDSLDPATAANVARNIDDLKMNLMAPGCVLVPLGQAAWNVLKRYNLPAALMADGKCMPDWSHINSADLFQTLRRLRTTSPQ